MKHGAAAVVVAIALAVPAFGQHGGGGHGGSVGHSGSAGHAGFSGSRGFSGGVATPRYGGSARPATPMGPGGGVPYRGMSQYRPAYRPGFGNRGGDNRGRGRHGWYGGGYRYPGWGYGYPYYPYPYVIDPGFYDWGTDDNGYDQNSAANNSPPYADYGQPYPETQPEPYYGQPYGPDPGASQAPYPPQPPYAQAPYPTQPFAQSPAPGGRRPSYGEPSAVAPDEEPVTLVFKNGRAPQTMRNYVMSSSMLTDMDPQHFERIPLDEIDIAETVRVNRDHGVDFQVPSAMRD